LLCYESWLLMREGYYCCPSLLLLCCESVGWSEGVACCEGVLDPVRQLSCSEG